MGSLLTAKVSLELDGAGKVKAQMIAEAREAAGAAGTAGGKDFGDAFTRDSLGRLHDSRGKYVTEGQAAGSGFGNAFDKGTATGFNNTSKRAKKMGSDVKKGSKEAQDGLGLLAKSALAIGPALVPLAGAGVAGTLALSTAAVSAGIGFASLGAVALPAITNIKDALKLAAKEGSAALNSLTPAEKNLYGATHSLNTAYQQWYKTLEPDVLPQLAIGINIAQRQLPKFTGLVKGSSAGLHDFLIEAGAAANGPIFNSFTKNLSAEAGPAIKAFGGLLLGAGSAATQTYNYLAPLAPQVDKLVTSFGQKIASGAGSAGFHGFLDSLISDAPLAGKVLTDLGRDAGGLIGVLEPLGHLSLGALDGLLTTVQPLIPELRNLASALDQNVGAISPVLQAYAQLTITIAGGLIGALTHLVTLVGNNATAFQILATAALSLKLASKAKEAIAASSAFTALSKAVKGEAVAEGVLASAGAAKGLSTTAANAEKAAVKVGGFGGVMQVAKSKLTSFNVVGGLVTGVLAGVAAGFISAQRETAQFNAGLESQFKSASKSVNLLNPVAAQTSLSFAGLAKSGDLALAAFDNIGINNTATQSLNKLRGQAADASGVLLTLGQHYGVSAKQAGTFAQQAGYSGDQIAAIGATVKKYDFDKLFSPFSGAAQQDAQSYNKQIKDLYGSIDAYKKSVTQASDPTYNLAQAIKDLGTGTPVDNIQAVNTALENYSTLAIGTSASSASAGDALAQLKTTFDKNTTSAQKNSAATQTLSGDLLLAGPKTRGFAQSLAGLNSQYTANLESTFKAAGGASNLAKAGAQVVKTSNNQKHALYDTLLAMGLNTSQASKLAEKYASIPKTLKTKIDADNSAALKKAKAADDAAKGYATKNYTAHLGADDKAAIAAASTATQRTRAFADAKYQADLTADNSDSLNKTAIAKERATSFAAARYRAIMDAVDNSAGAIGHADASARAYADTGYAASIGAVDNASGTIGYVSNELGSLNGRSATTYIDTVYRTVGKVGGLGSARASGGWAHGPGTGTSDSFLQPTSNGEFTVNARAARANASLLEAINSGRISTVGHGASAAGTTVATPAPVVVQVMVDKRVIARAVADGAKINAGRGM